MSGNGKRYNAEFRDDAVRTCIRRRQVYNQCIKGFGNKRSDFKKLDNNKK